MRRHSAGCLLKLQILSDALGNTRGHRGHHHFAADASNLVSVFAITHVEAGEQRCDLTNDPGERACAWNEGVNNTGNNLS